MEEHHLANNINIAISKPGAVERIRTDSNGGSHPRPEHIRGSHSAIIEALSDV